MNRYTKPSSLAGLSFLSAAMSWLPMIMVPGIDLPVWIPLTCVAMSAALPAFLNCERWQLFVRSSITGSFVGLCIGYVIWPPNEKVLIATTLFVTLGTVASIVVALPIAFVASELSVLNHGLSGAAWVAFWITVVFGPTCLALTPSIVSRRIARNESIAADRIVALQGAVERTLAASVDRAEICDGSALARNYTGPAFTDEDWRRIAGNAVRQDGYIFAIYCRNKSGYTIDARPDRDREDGKRWFCIDESGKMECGNWNRSGVCLPCTK